jgi:hypothetical protein
MFSLLVALFTGVVGALEMAPVQSWSSGNSDGTVVRGANLSGFDDAWLAFAALPRNASAASLRVTVQTASDVWIETFWQPNSSLPTQQPSAALERGAFARLIGTLRFNTSTTVASVDLTPITFLARPFVLRLRLAPLSFGGDSPTLTAAVVVVRESATDRAAAAAACSMQPSCESCLAHNSELCGFCAGQCRFGWRSGALDGACVAAWQYSACTAPNRLVRTADAECALDDANLLLRFALDTAAWRSRLSSASLTLTGLADDDARPTAAAWRVAQPLSPVAADAPLCELDLGAAFAALGRVPIGRVVVDVTAALGDLLRANASSLVVWLSPERADGLALPRIGRTGDPLHARAEPLLAVELLPPGATLPPSLPSGCGGTACSGHGVCRLERCFCTSGYAGVACAVVVEPPTIAAVPSAVVADATLYEMPLVVSGTGDVTVLALSLPDGAEVVNATRLVRWPHAVRRAEPHRFAVSAVSDFGEATREWLVTVVESDFVVQVSVSKSTCAAGAAVAVDVRTPQPTALTLVARKAASSDWFVVGNEPPFSFSASVPGRYELAAVRLGEAIDAVPAASRGSVNVLGVALHVNDAPLTLPPGSTSSLPELVRLHNPSAAALTGVRVLVRSDSGAALSAASSNVTDVPSLAPGASLWIPLQLIARREVELPAPLVRDQVVVTVVSTGAVSVSATVALPVVMRRRDAAALELLDADALLSSVRTNSSRLVAFRVRNGAVVPLHYVVLELGAASSFVAPVSAASLRGLAPNETAVFELRVRADAQVVAGSTLVGTLSVSADVDGGDGERTVLSVPFAFAVTAAAHGSLLVAVESEATYHGEPRGALVASAVVTLVDADGRTAARQNTTSRNTPLMFDGVLEGEYELRVEASGHQSARQLVSVLGGVARRVTIFISRSGVTVTWRVVPVSIRDQYDVVLDAAFATNVPAPVMSFEPSTLSVSALCARAVVARRRNETLVVQFNITNHGLIRGENFDAVWPRDLPLVDLEPLAVLPPTIAARQTVLVPVAVRLRQPLPDCALPAERRRQERSDGGAPRTCGSFGFAVATIDCGLQVSVYSSPALFDFDCNNYAGPPPFLRGGTGGSSQPPQAQRNAPFIGYASKQICGPSVNASECFNNLVSLGLTCGSALELPIPDAIGVIWDVMKEVRWASTEAEKPARVVDGIRKFLTNPETWIGMIPVFGRLWSGLACARDGVTTGCSFDDAKAYLFGGGSAGFGALRSGRKRDVVSSLDASSREVVDALAELAALERTLLYPFGGPFLLNARLADRDWLVELTQAIAARASAPPPSAPVASVGAVLTQLLGATALARLSVSITAERQRVLERLAVSAFYGERPSWFNDSNWLDLDQAAAIEAAGVSVMLRAEQRKLSPWARVTEAFAALQRTANEPAREGVCAVVRIRVEQRVTLTRVAFEASLTLANGAEAEPLHDIGVELRVLDAARQTVPDAIVSVTMRGAPLSTIEPGAEPVTWTFLIAPADAAAPRARTSYFVVGTLRYRAGQAPLTVADLQPELIEVLPNPRLRFDYFLPRRVLGDDPFTADVVEPPVPFSLGLVVSNDGYGTAVAMTIATAEPRIVDNARGLLVDFALVAARVNTEPATQPTLSVALGDVGPLSSSAVVWSLTASLQGEFVALNATFRQTSLLDGAPQLTSVVDRVQTHRLVRAVEARADQLSMFLVDDVDDANNTADAVHVGRFVNPVQQVGTVTALLAPDGLSALVTFSVLQEVPLSQLTYVRVEDVTNEAFALLGCVSSTTGRAAVDVWRERFVERPAGESPRTVRWLHLLTNNSDGTSWRVQTAQPRGALRVASVSASAVVLAWSNATVGAFVSVTRDVAGGGPVARALVSSTDGSAVVGDLAPNTAYVARVTDAVARFVTTGGAPAGANVTVCTGSPCAGGVLDSACKCTCRGGWSGSQCDSCSLSCTNGGKAAILGGECTCICPESHTGPLCAQSSLDDAGCVHLGTLVSLCFDEPRPRSAVLANTSNSASALSFAASSQPSAPIAARIVVRGVDAAARLVDSTSGAAAGSDCLATQQLSADGTLTVGTLCSALGAFALETGSAASTTSPIVTSSAAVASSTAASPLAPSPSAHANVGLVVGLIVGLFVLLALMGGTGYYFYRRRLTAERHDTELS